MEGVVRYNEDGYDEVLLNEAYQLALLGLKDSELCQVWGITKSVFDGWKKDEAFRSALERGRLQADSKVAMALFKRATGFSYYEDHITVYKGVPQVTRIERYVPPDAWSAVKWLGLKRPALWSETHKVDVTNTNININKFDFTGISDEELMMLKKIGLNQLTRNAQSSQ